MITKDNVIEKLLKDDVIVQSYVYSFKSKKYWTIEKPITVKLSTGKIISIPKGFTYDMASVPKCLWSICRPFNDGLFGTLVHDYLYIHQEKHNMTRRQVDKEYLFWNRITNGNKFDNCVRYIFVRLLGWLYWKKII